MRQEPHLRAVPSQPRMNRKPLSDRDPRRPTFRNDVRLAAALAPRRAGLRDVSRDVTPPAEEKAVPSPAPPVSRHGIRAWLPAAAALILYADLASPAHVPVGCLYGVLLLVFAFVSDAAAPIYGSAAAACVFIVIGAVAGPHPLDGALLIDRLSALAVVGAIVLLARQRVSSPSSLKTVSDNETRLVAMCGHCKRIRGDGGRWQDIELFIREHAGSECSHSVCQCCAKRVYNIDLDNDDGVPPSRHDGKR